MKRSFRTAIAIAFASLCLCASADATVVTIKIRGAQGGVFPTAINDSGQLVGSYLDKNNRNHGFLRQPDGTLTTFLVPGEPETIPRGISADGVIIGVYYNAQEQPGGFVRATDGSITTFTVPNSFASFPAGMNSAGWIAGSYVRTENGKLRSFLTDPSGATTEFAAPHARKGTAARAVNNSQTIAGVALVQDDKNYPVGFSRSADGTITEFGDPNTGFEVVGINDAGTIAGSDTIYSEGLVRTSDGTITTYQGPNGAYDTRPAAINNAGTIVGSYRTNSDFNFHGYIRTADGTITAFNPIRSLSSTITAINNSGVIAGTYTNKNSGIQHAFVGTP